MEILYGAKNGVHAFSYNSSESELIWMKSRALWVHCWGLALADFGCDPHSSDHLRGSWNFVVFLSGKQCTISGLPNFAKFEHYNINQCCHVNFRNIILKILFFFWWKNAKTTKLTFYDTSGFRFTVRSIQSLSRGLYAAHKEPTSHMFGIVRCLILGNPRTPLQLPGFQHWRKADWIGNWK